MPMCVGVLTGRFAMSHYYRRIKEERSIFVNVVGILSVAGLLHYEDYHCIHLILCPILLLVLCDEHSWINRVLNKKIFKDAGNLGYAVYLNHTLVIWMTLDIEQFVHNEMKIGYSKNVRYVIFGMLLTIYYLATTKIVARLKKSRRENGYSQRSV